MGGTEHEHPAGGPARRDESPLADGAGGARAPGAVLQAGRETRAWVRYLLCLVRRLCHTSKKYVSYLSYIAVNQ